MDPNQGLAAYLSGTGDLYIGGIPQRLRSLSEGHDELLTGGHLGPGSVPLVGFATTQEILDEKGDAMLRLFNVWNRTSRYAAESPEKTEELGVFIARLLNEKTGAQMKPSDFKTMFNGWQHFPPTVADWKSWYERISPEERWELASEFFVDVKGTIAEKPDYAVHIVIDQFLDDYEAKYGTDQ
jgi:ABC-type nitrate/sulfonate/bicarbonate transport system substrate-binding protein